MPKQSTPSLELSDCVGSWMLVGSAEIREDAVIEENGTYRSVRSWLNGSGIPLLETVKTASGLSLEIQADQSFSEEKQGNPDITWYDAEGVLENEVTPFSGSLVVRKQGIFLRPSEIPSWAKPPLKGRYGHAVLRYDDGDTKICDRLEKHDDSLIRTINVVTDELYLDRIVLVYQQYT